MFWNKPKAIIVVSRLTGQQEQASITVNSYSTDSAALYRAVKNAADALQERLVENNMAAISALEGKEVTKESIDDKKVLNISGYKKHKNKDEVK